MKKLLLGLLLLGLLFLLDLLPVLDDIFYMNFDNILLINVILIIDILIIKNLKK